MATSINFGMLAWLLAITALVAWIVHSSRQQGQRRSRIQRFLFSQDFVPAELPGDLPLGSLDPGLQNGEVVFCYTGSYAGCRAVVAELRLGSGRNSYAQTLVAVQRITTAPFEPVPFLQTLQIRYDQADRWLMGTIDRATMDVEAIEGYLACFT